MAHSRRDSDPRSSFQQSAIESPRARLHFSRRLRLEPLEARRLLSITVDTLIDESNGIAVGGISLRDAIATAAPGETIDFSVTGVINLQHGEFVITDALTIDGPGADLLTIDAQQRSRIFNVTTTDGDQRISGVTLTGGQATGDGGAISFRSSGALTLADSVVHSNLSGRHGGGIFADGDVMLTNSTVNRNQGNGGGGIYVEHGDVTITDSTVSGNSDGNEGGGGILAIEGNVALLHSSVSENSAEHLGGGGIFAHRGNVTLTNSTVSGNTVGEDGGGGGVLAVDGNVSVTDSTVSGNTARRGGGIYSGDGDVTLTGSTISGNTASSGGGIAAFFGAVDLMGSTVSQNTAFDDGGGIHASFGNVTLKYSTVSGNTAFADGGGIHATDGDVTLTGSIVGGNSAGGSGPDAEVQVIVPRHSLVGDASGTTQTPTGPTPDANGNLIGSTAAPMDPQLGPLQYNGGPTQTHALLPGSPAIDAGDSEAVAGDRDVPLYDQRGELFDRVVGGQIDMGAFELGGLFGDLNNDGVVGRADVAIVAGAFGRRADATYGQGDLNGDRAVNLIDVLLLKRNLGAGLPSLQPSAAIGAAKSASPVERAAATDMVFDDSHDDRLEPTTRTSRRSHSLARDGRLTNRNAIDDSHAAVANRHSTHRSASLRPRRTRTIHRSGLLEWRPMQSRKRTDFSD